MNVAAIVLAAGTSSRMGRPKLLLPFEGKSLVRRAVESAHASRARGVIVVTGAYQEAIEREVAGLPIRLTHNPDYAAGMSGSLRAGLQALRPETDAAVVLLADQPFVGPEVIDALIELYELTRAPIVRPRYAGQPGNPVLWDRSLFGDLMRQEGDQGGRMLLRAHADQIAWRELPDARIQEDVDTPEVYAALLRAYGVDRPDAAPSGDEPPPTATVNAPSLASSGGTLPSDASDRGDAEGQPAETDRDGGTPRTAASDDGTQPNAHEHHDGHGLGFCGRCGQGLAERVVEGRVRPVCPACDTVVWADPKVAAAVVIPWEDGILLGRRAIDPGRGRWSFPSGYVDRGEVVEEAARREVREETGLDVTLSGLVGVYSSEGNPVILIVYAAEPPATEPKPGPEVEELRAFPPDALPDMAFAHDDRIIQDWLALRRRRVEVR